MRIPTLLLGAASLVALAPVARAGGGPETTLVVVNASSPVSKQIANAYVARRGIPAANVVEVDGVPTLRVVSIDTFRDRLWAPVKAFLAAHDPKDRIDLVVWSADFPYGVDFAADEPKPPNPPYTGIASLTAMTYFARAVEAKQTEKWLPLNANGYYRRGGGEWEPRAPSDAEQAAFDEAEAALKTKDYAKAAEAYGRGLATYAERDEHLYDYACCLARTGRPEEALEALRKAVAKGFRHAELARKDEDLASIRDRREFAALLVAMDAPPATWDVQPARGFRARAAWTGGLAPVDEVPEGSLDRYRLSTVLAYTGEEGTSVPETLRALDASIAADGTNPDGTFYFLVNGDVRATTRKGRFEGAVAALRERGRKAEILEAGKDGQTGVLPIGKDDVLGAMVGIAGFDWAASKSRILPGAIVEHLTSFGALFAPSGQTKCTRFIAAGAAGSSGAVNEPYALEAKFPVPALHVHYADGCSLAESFFASVFGPYQLLVLGDGLARPFARFGRVSLPPTVLRGKGAVEVLPAVEPAAGRPSARVELFVDGAYAGEGPPGAALPLDTTGLDDGVHELRAVSVEADPVETRTSATGLLEVRNGTRTVSIDGGGPRKADPYEGNVVVQGKALGAKTVTLLAGRRELGTAPATNGTWRLSVPAARLGVGPTTVQARATGDAGPAVRSAFVTVAVAPPVPRKGVPAKGAKKGFVATLSPANGKPVEVPLGNLGGAAFPSIGKALEGKVAGAVKDVTIAGEVDVAEAGSYQLVLTTVGTVSVDVDGKPALAPTKATRDRQVGAAFGLAAGRHTLVIRLVPDGAPDLSALLGGDRVLAPLESK